MRERIRWQAHGAPLDDAQLVLLSHHVEYWRDNVRGYDLRVPRARAPGPQLYGELLLVQPIAVRGPLPDLVTRVLDALSELSGLLPSLTVTAMTDDVVFSATPMGFERRARVAGDDIGVRPEGWVGVTDVAPLAQPIRSLADEASLHAVPIAEPPPPATPGFHDLDRDDDATALVRADAIAMRAATSALLVSVAWLRDRPRGDDEQVVFDRAMTALGSASTSGVAPTLVLALEVLRPEGARDRAWCEQVLQTVEADALTRGDLAAVRDVLAEGSTSVLVLSRERRAQLLAYEADDVASAEDVYAAAAQWFEDNRERLDELTAPSASPPIPPPPRAPRPRRR
jgi:hypothetical protein